MNAPNGPLLRDIHLPPPPSWWPPAPGWWLLAFISLALCIATFVFLRKRRRVQRRHRAMLGELDRCIERAGDDAPALASALSQFLRRMVVRERPDAAAFAGAAWLEFLDTRLSGDEFRSGIGRVLIDAPYRMQAEFDRPALIALVRRWARATLDAQVSHA